MKYIVLALVFLAADAKYLSGALNDCGCASATNRIVGGEEVNPNSLPYQALFQVNKNSCGGTIINKRYVISAMHCIFDQESGNKLPVEQAHVYLGVHDRCNK